MQHKIYYSDKNIGKSKNIIFAMFHYEQGKKVRKNGLVLFYFQY